MVRIAGIDKDFTTLELMFHQATDEEKLTIAAGHMANLAIDKGAFEIKMTMDSDTVVTVSTKVES